MSAQPSLFDAPVQHGRVRATDRQTSADAARRTRAGSTRALILEVFAAYGALTDDELCKHLEGKHPPTVKSARTVLFTEGWLEDTGGKRLSNLDCLQTVWKLRARD